MLPVQSCSSGMLWFQVGAPGRSVTGTSSSRSGVPTRARRRRPTTPRALPAALPRCRAWASPWRCCVCCSAVRFGRPWAGARWLLLGNAYHTFPEQRPCFLHSGCSLTITKSLCWGGEKADKRFVERMELFEVHFTSPFTWPPYMDFVLVSSNEEITGWGEVDQGHPSYRNTFPLLMLLLG